MKWVENRITYDKLEFHFLKFFVVVFACFTFPLMSLLSFLLLFVLTYLKMCQNCRLGNVRIQIQYRAK